MSYYMCVYIYIYTHIYKYIKHASMLTAYTHYIIYFHNSEVYYFLMDKNLRTETAGLLAKAIQTPGTFQTEILNPTFHHRVLPPPIH
jgi:hypothetical protein